VDHYNSGDQCYPDASELEVYATLGH